VVKRLLDIFSLRMRRNGYLGTSDKNIGPRHSLRRHRFPIRRVYFHYPRWRFRHIFDVLCTIFIWPCDFDFRPFDLGCVWRI